MLLIGIVTAFGVSLWFSVICVQFRDVKFILPFFTQIWMYATPVIYPSSMIPEGWRILYGLNPMVFVVEGFRWALLGKTVPPDLAMMGVSLAVIVLLIGGGLWFFSRCIKASGLY